MFMILGMLMIILMKQRKEGFKEGNDGDVKTDSDRTEDEQKEKKEEEKKKKKNQ